MKYLITAAFLLWCWPSLGQAASSSLFPLAVYPQDYFRDPLGIPMSLAANFGELRPDHYHMGLDIRTQHRENLPVYAAADGYVERVQVGPFGFGQAIYIRHPNGFMTVYGHLNRFFPALDAYVKEQQYRQQSWQVNLSIPSSLFSVRKGQQIAWSGNTGGSQGPHLHFEIRLGDGAVNLNPLLFGLPVKDWVAPVIQQLAWYDGNQGIYEQKSHLLPVIPGRVRASGGPSAPASKEYGIPYGVLIVPVSRIGFAISASDAQSGSVNPNGIYQAELVDDRKPVIGFRMDHIGYDDTRNINAHIDYKTRNLGGPFLQQLFFLSGYPFPSIYRIPGPGGGVDPAKKSEGGVRADGFIDLSDGREHPLSIDVTDTRGNSARLAFRVQFRAAGDSASAVAASGKRFYPGMVDGIETDHYAFFLGEKSLYDSATIGAAVSGYPGSGFSIPGAVSAAYSIGARYIPLMDAMLVRLRLPDSTGVTPGEQPASTDRIVMVCFQGADRDVERPEWQGGWASARFHQFGTFQLVYDSIPPVISPAGPLDGADLSHARRIAFTIRDNLGAVRHFRAELDGRWLCFTNDKGLAYIYTFDQHCGPGLHTLKVSVEDVAGNRTENEYHFSR
jgi:Peptidase family M23